MLELPVGVQAETVRVAPVAVEGCCPQAAA